MNNDIKLNIFNLKLNVRNIFYIQVQHFIYFYNTINCFQSQMPNYIKKHTRIPITNAF